jgi:hypothetical protein
MKVLVIWLFMLGLFFGLHFLVWRYMKIFQSKKILLIILGIVFFSIGFFKVTLLQFLHISLAYFSVGFSYLIFYLWLEGDSPTLHFIDLLSRQPSASMPLKTLKGHFSDNNPITGRLKILVEEDFCVYEPPNYRLSPKGIWAARVCSAISHTFNIALEG